MRHQPRDDRARSPAGARLAWRSGDRRPAGRGIGVAAQTRLNRYLAAAGLGDRRSVERLIGQGRVAIDGVRVESPAVAVVSTATVTLDGAALTAPPTAAVAFHRPPGGAIDLVHPPVLHAVPLPVAGGGLELLFADAALALRIADERYPPPQRVDSRGRRTRLASVELGDLVEGAWRPLAPRELEALRRSVRLPPRPSGE